MTILINTAYSIQGYSFEDTFVHTMHKHSLYKLVCAYMYINIRYMFVCIQTYVQGIIPLVSHRFDPHDSFLLHTYPKLYINFS